MNNSTSASAPAVLRKSFKSRAEFAEFALSPLAPRFSAFPSRDSLDLLPFLGVSLGEALFSDDLSALRRAILRWNENGFEVYIDIADQAEFPGASDAWYLKAKVDLPDWFLEGFFGSIYSAPPLSASPAEVEELALDELCVNGTLDYTISMQDKLSESDQEYLADILNEPEEEQAWDWRPASDKP